MKRYFYQFIVLVITAIFVENAVASSDSAELQRRDSFRQLEGIRVMISESLGRYVSYDNCNEELRPSMLMDDITQPGQSTAEINRIMAKFKICSQELYQYMHQYLHQLQKSVSFEDAIKMSEEELTNVNEIVIKLEDTYDRGDRTNPQTDLYRVLKIAQEVTLVVDCGDATEITDNALKFDIFSMQEMKKIKVVGPNITRLGNYFLHNFINLISVDLTSLSNVTKIGNKFLSECYCLTFIDLNPLSEVTQIGDGFLGYCYNLIEVDLSPLSEVTQIGSGLLENCTALTNVLMPLSISILGKGAFFLCNNLRCVTIL